MGISFSGTEYTSEQIAYVFAKFGDPDHVFHANTYQRRPGKEFPSSVLAGSVSRSLPFPSDRSVSVRRNGGAVAAKTSR
jgi:hypothetical protein